MGRELAERYENSREVHVSEMPQLAQLTEGTPHSPNADHFMLELDREVNQLGDLDVRLGGGRWITDAQWFYVTEGEPHWEGSRLTKKILQEPLYKVGTYKDETIDGIYRIKERDLDDHHIDLVDGMIVYFVPSKRKFQKTYWAKMISLTDPQLVRIPNVDIDFTFGSEALSLESAILAARMINRMKFMMGVGIEDTDTAVEQEKRTKQVSAGPVTDIPWIFTPTKEYVVRRWKGIMYIIPNTTIRKHYAIQDFKHFLWVYRKSTEDPYQRPINFRSARRRDVVPYFDTFSAPGPGSDGVFDRVTFSMLKKIYLHSGTVWNSISGAEVKDLFALTGNR